jgi:hypothetical protein
MWTTTYHRFPSRAAFLATCAQAGWECLRRHEPSLPHGVAMDIIGPLIGSARIGEDGMLIAGEVIDPRYHLNLAWYGREPDPTFQASWVAPATPSRVWDITAPPVAHPPVPPVIPAWKGKAALREPGLLEAVEAAVTAAGGSVQMLGPEPPSGIAAASFCRRWQPCSVLTIPKSTRCSATLP